MGWGSDEHRGFETSRAAGWLWSSRLQTALEGSHLKTQAKAARKKLETILGVPITHTFKKMKQNTVRLRVAGVFFWDVWLQDWRRELTCVPPSDTACDRGNTWKVIRESASLGSSCSSSW